MLNRAREQLQNLTLRKLVDTITTNPKEPFIMPIEPEKPATQTVNAVNFKRLAEGRVNRLLKQLQLISNLGNRNNYHYTEEDVSQIFSVIQKAVVEAAAAFEQKELKTFTLGGFNE